MYFDSLAQLLHMDGHGVFVWGAYAISAVVLAANVVLPWRRYRRELRDLANLRQSRQPGGLR